MKVHLPLSLRKALLSAVTVAAAVSATVEAGVMHSGVSLVTYTDFGQNLGRYAVGNTNALLNYIREQEGGVRIVYVNPDVNAAYVLPHGMIDFSSQNDGGYGAAIGYNFYATVEHNGTHNNTFSGNYIGAENAIHYQTIEFRYDWQNNKIEKTFILTPSNDYKIGRQSKLITDVTGSTVYGSVNRDWSALVNNGPLGGQLLYRSGSGTMQGADTDGTRYDLAAAYTYITGGLASISNTGSFNAADGAISTNVHMRDYTLDGINEDYPIPFVSMSGDSGSPAWIWNESTGRFEYLTALQSGSLPSYSQFRSAPQWTVETMESFNVKVDLSANAVDTVRIGAVDRQGATFSDELGHSTTTWIGTVTDGSNKLAEFIGVKTGLNTWKDLSGIKDNANWYTYDTEMLNTESVTYWDLFKTQDLVFSAGVATTSIQADADVDLGIGYVRLSKGNQTRARFNIEGDHLINSAGYVIDSGVDAYITLTNPAGYMREWRAVVEQGGTLHIEGSGDTNALLNLGGQGATYLNRTGGYAAYNVLANNGATVVISDVNQIKRDFTFGFRGGVLDMNGNSMTWNNDNAAAAEGFTIHALDEQAVLTNMLAGSTTTLTWTQGGAQTWLGSFRDSTGGGALKFIYNGGAGSVLTLRSIHTDLGHVAGSGITVQSGTVMLEGTNTVHGTGSLNGRSKSRYFSNRDWHYVDISTPLTVQDGGTFELASHARLSGDVTIEQGGTFVMREGTQSQYEYIEGGQILEDTYAIRDFYGLKGNVVNNGTLRVEYGSGATTNNVYAGAISGGGSLVINTGMDGAVLELSGANTMTGTRSVTEGALVLKNAAALGSATGANAWKIGEKAWMAVEGVAQNTLPDRIHSDSAGSLALSQDTSVQLDMSGHTDLFLGAETGKKVQYGEQGTADELAAWHPTGGDGRKQWLLGGGGGEIVVNWKLTGNNDLVLGNPYMSGTVTLTNTGNDFTGNILFTQGSNVVLNFTDPRALGGATVDLAYGKAMSGGLDIASMLAGSTITTGAAGILLVDDSANAAIDLSGHSSLQLGANGGDVHFRGDITVARDGAYRLGGPGTLVIENALAANGTNNLVVDAQGFRGGMVVLNSAAAITGAVTVMGYDAAQSATTNISSGDMVLDLAVGHALDSASSVTAQNGGTLFISRGTTQNIATLNVNAGGEVVLDADTTLNVNGLWVAQNAGLYGSAASVMNLQSATILGTLEAGDIVKTGSGRITVVSGSEVSFKTLDIREGSLYLGTDMLSSGTIVVHGDNSITFNGNSIGAALDSGAGETVSFSGAAMGLKGSNIHMASGGTLNLRNVATVNLAVDGAGSAQSYLGTVELGNTKLVNVTYNNAEYEFTHVDVSGNAELAVASTNAVWTLHSLTGSGQLLFNASHSAGNTNRLVLDGSGTFSGEVYLNRSTASNGKGAHRFSAFLEIAHDDALQNAGVRLRGNGGWAYSALAVNTECANILGLNSGDASGNGGRYSVVYAGAALTDSQEAKPESSRNAILDLTGSGTYHYYGGVSGSSAFALDLLKSGSGTQTFADGAENSDDCRTAAFRNVTVLGGTLNLNNTHTVIYGDYAVGLGGTLAVAGGVSLDAGHSLSVLEGTDASATTATLNGALSLNGGSLGFSALTLPAGTDSYLLDLAGGVSLGSGVTGIEVDFLDTGYLREGTYRLASGDFAGLGLTAASFTATNAGHYNVAFAVTAEGLSVTFGLAGDTIVWEGTDAQHAWTATQFGPKAIAEGKTTFLFTDLAPNKEVKVSENATLSTAGATFDASGKYTVSTDNGSTATIARLEKQGEGDLELESGLAVTGSTSIQAGRVLLHGNALQGSISGDGTLALASASASLNGLAGSIGTLEILGGASHALGAGAALTAATVDVNGGALAVADSFTYNGKVLAHQGAIILGSGSKLSNLEVQGGTTVSVASGTGGLAAVTNRSGAALSKTGAGTLALTDKTAEGDFIVQEGTLILDSYDFLYLTGIDLRAGTKLVLNKNWTSVGPQTGVSAVQISLADGAVIEMYNGANNTRVNAHIRVDATTAAAKIRGIINGSDMFYAGTVSGTGTLQLLSLNDGVRSANSWALDSAVYNGTDGALRLEMKDARLSIGGTSANTYTGGTSISNSSVAVNKAAAFGTGALELADASELILGSDLIVGALSGGAGNTITANGHKLALLGTAESATYGSAISGLSLEKAGAGAQAFTNVINLQDVEVKAGTLSLSGQAMELTGEVTVAQNAELLLGGGISLAAPIVNDGTLGFAADALISLSMDQFSNDRYYITSGSGVTSGLGLANFSIDGMNAAELGTVSLSSLAGGDVYLYIAASVPEGPLTWNGTDSNHTWIGENWLSGEAAPSFFYPQKDVLFTADASNKNVQVADVGVEAASVSISGSGYNFSGGKVTVSGDLAVETGASAVFNNELEVAGDVSLQSGAGLTLGHDAELSPIEFAAGSTLKVATGSTLTVAGASKTDVPAYFAHVASDAANRGTVSMDVAKVDSQLLQGVHTVAGGFLFTAASGFEINNWNGSAAYDSLVQVQQGGSLTVAGGVLTLSSYSTLNIQGGDVSAPTVVVGTLDGNTPNCAHLTLESGSLTTHSLTLRSRSGNANHVTSFTMTGGTLDLRGGTGTALSVQKSGSGYHEVSITGGTIKVDAERSVDVDLTFGGVEIVSSSAGAGLVFASDKTVAWDGLVTNNGGTLTFNGTLALADAGEADATEDIYTDPQGAAGGSGYRARHQLVRNTNGGTVVLGEQASLSIGGVASSTPLVAGANGLYLCGTEYYINSGTILDYGAGSNAAATDMTTGLVLNGGSMNMQQSLTEGVVNGSGVTLQADATVNIATDAVLDMADVQKGAYTLTIDGSGTFINTPGPVMQAAMAAGWSGTVEVSGISDSPIQVNAYGRGSQSTVRFAGVSGWFQVDYVTIAENIEFATLDSGSALNITGTTQNKDYTFNGRVSGAGNARFVTGGNTNTFTFAGDVSGWTGELVHESTGGATTMVFSKDGDAVIGMGGIIHSGEGTLDVQISGSGAKTIAGSLTDTTLTMNGGGTLAFSRELAMTNGKLVINSGNVTLDRHDRGTSQLKNTAVEVNGGGMLTIQHDTMGWNANVRLKSILLQGSGEDGLRAVLNNDDNTGNNTCAVAITLAGHTLVKNSGSYSIRVWNGMGITATGDDNTISANLAVDHSFTIAVGDSGHPDSTLLISGNMHNGDPASKAVTKTGNGTLVLTGDNTADGDLTINGGVVEIGASGAGTGKWGGNVAVNNGGQLSLLKDDSLADGKTLTIGGTGVAAYTDAQGGRHEALVGALKLADGVTLSNNVTVASGGATIMTDNGVTASLGGAVSGGTATKAGAGTLELSTLNTDSSYGTWALHEGVVRVTQSGDVSLQTGNANTGTLALADNISINLGNVSGSAKYHLTGDGTLQFNVTGGNYYFESAGNEFRGTMEITLSGSIFIMGQEDNSAGANFAEGYHPDIVLTGNNGNGESAFILNSNYYGGKALDIGSLSTGEGSTAVAVTGANGGNPGGQSYRYISVHQDSDTMFAGRFDNTGNSRAVGLIMNGAGATGGGTLTLTADSDSTAHLIINSGTVQVGEVDGASGKWSGDVEVNAGGQLYLARAESLASGVTLALAGDGVAAFTDAADTAHAAREGALKLADGLALSNAITIADAGASVLTEGDVAASLSGALSGNGTLTKIGTGTLKLDRNATGVSISVAQGTLQLMQNIEVSGGKTLTVGADASLAGEGKTLTVNDNGANVTITGNATLAEVQGKGSLVVDGGTTNIAGLLGVWRGSMTIENAEVNANSLVMADKYQTNEASLTIRNGGVLNISGNTSDSLVIAGWAKNVSTGRLTVEGGASFTAADAVMQVSYWDNTTGTVNISGGSVEVKGVSFHHKLEGGAYQNTNVRGTLTLSDGGELTIGSEGIKGVEQEDGEDKVHVSLGEGTIKAKADWTMGRFTDGATLVDVSLTDAAHGTCFHTDGDGGGNGHTVTIDNNLVGSGSLVKDGAGTLRLNGRNSYEGRTTVKQGTLELGAEASLDNGHVTIAANSDAAAGTLRSTVIDGMSVSGLSGEEKGETANLKLLYNNARLTVKDMVISADSYIGKAPVESVQLLSGNVEEVAASSPTELAMQGSTLRLQNEVNVTSIQTRTLSAQEADSAALTWAAGSSLTSLTCTSFNVDVLSGTLALDLSPVWTDLVVAGNHHVAVCFEGVDSIDPGAVITASAPVFGVAVPAVSYGTVGGSAVAYFDIEAVPEPATGGLSSLLLAALAARRKRRSKVRTTKEDA